MNPRRMLAMTRKEFLHVLRDVRSMTLAVVIPVMLLLLFGYALTLDVDRVPLVIWDQDNTPASRGLASRFLGSRYFALHKHAGGYGELESAIDRGEAVAALVIPVGFARSLDSDAGAAVQFIVDGSDNNTATIVLGYADAVGASYGQGLALDGFRRQGLPPPAQPLDARPRAWFNTDLESKNFIIPGLIAVIMMIIAALLTSLTVAREWERGTMEQLVSTPVRASELILGKLTPYLVIGMLDVLLAVAMGQFLFGVPMRGSLALLLAMASVFLVGAMSMGILISVFARNQLVASQLAILVTFVPSYLLSGFMFAIHNMPAPIQAVTYAVPARYFIVVLKGVYLKGVGLKVLGFQAALLVLFALVMVVAANLKFKKKLG